MREATGIARRILSFSDMPNLLLFRKTDARQTLVRCFASSICSESCHHTTGIHQFLNYASSIAYCGLRLGFIVQNHSLRNVRLQSFCRAFEILLRSWLIAGIDLLPIIIFFFMSIRKTTQSLARLQWPKLLPNAKSLPGPAVVKCNSLPAIFAADIS
jgi:hypothetical protein